MEAEGSLPRSQEPGSNPSQVIIFYCSQL